MNSTGKPGDTGLGKMGNVFPKLKINIKSG